MRISGSYLQVSAVPARFAVAFLIAAFAILQAAPADAFPSRRHGTHVRHAAAAAVAACSSNEDTRYFCGSASATSRVSTRRVRGVEYVVLQEEGTIIGSRPADCPHAYCGCGLRKYLGIADVRLNLAANWAKFFPREAAPRAGLAAVRRGHVMYLEASAGNGLWTVRDYNSGGGLSRIHVRDVRGHVFVNPHAGMKGTSRVAARDGATPSADRQAAF